MVFVIAKMHAREGQENRLKEILTALVVASRQEKGNLRYDLLIGEDDPLEFAIYEEWETAIALNAHLRATHISSAHGFADELTDRPPLIISYSKVEPVRQFTSGPTRKLEPDDPQS